MTFLAAGLVIVALAAIGALLSVTKLALHALGAALMACAEGDDGDDDDGAWLPDPGGDRGAFRGDRVGGIPDRPARLER